MRLWLTAAFAAVSLITAGAVYLFGDNAQALVAAVMIGVLAGFLIAVAISHRVVSLARAAGEMAGGSFDAPLSVSGPDEIGDLARALDSMRASLKESFGVLTADRNKLAAIFDGLTDVVMVVDFEGPVRFSNSAAARLLEEADGKPPEVVRPQLQRASEVGFSAHPALRIGDRAYAMTARSLPDERAVLAVLRDRTDELRRELAEADFVSNAAHELRNPLAGISGAIEVLQGGAKDDPGDRDHFLSRLADDAERMSRLTQSLLTLARVESRGAAEMRDRRRPDRGPRRRRRGRGPATRRAERRGRAGAGRQRRPDAAAPGDDRLAHQRLQEHAAARHGYRSRPSRRRARGHLGGGRHWNRNPNRGDRARFRALLQATGVAQAGGVRPRLGDRPPHGRRHGRPDRRRVDRGGGQHLLGPPSRRKTKPDPGRMSSGRILIADDEPSVRDSVGYALAQEGFDVTAAEDGDRASELLGNGVPFDLLILDIMMPGPSGLDICRDVRSRSAVPIIVLTAKDAEVDKVVGLEVGADDYVTKPFSVRELLGRVRAQLRRRELDRSPLAQAVNIEAGPVSIDLVRHVASVRGTAVNLTRSEFQLLRLLVGRPGEVFARSQIMEELWQTEFDGDERACDVHISNLRQKVERDPQRPELVLTVRGVGYKYSPDGA